ncbi:MAG: hypothetical protein AABW67_01795 [Nanoarchaeota archaeon]
MSIIASAVMLSSTLGFASAATFPAPFDSGSAIVYGANGNVQMDMAAAVNIQTAIGKVSSVGDINIPEGSWQVKTTADKLEIGEAINGVATYIDKEDLPLLADGQIDNEKGAAKYEQFFYFDDNVSSMVKYQDDGDDNVGLFYKINSGQLIARYVLDFTTNLESDVAVSTLEDIDDEEITILGKTYTIITAVNSSATNTDLTLMSGANKVVINNGEELTVGGKTISVLVSSATQAQFTVDGQTTAKLNAGDTEKLSDGTYLGVSEITYQSFSGGIMQATAYVGADKLFLDDGSDLIVNAETINNAKVTIAETYASGDVSIDSITINMTAEDDLYVPVNGKLSEATDLDEPQVLISQNWDIIFKGLGDATYETIDLKKSTDSRIVLNFENFNGDKIDTPLMFTNTTGVYGGEKAGYELILAPSLTNISKNQYFILNTADPTLAANSGNARSYVVQYKGADKTSDTSPKMKFNILGVDSGKEVTLATAGTADLKLGGTTFSFTNGTSCASAIDCKILLSAGEWADGTYLANDSISNYFRTKYNVLINITDSNATLTSTGTASNGAAGLWTVIMSIDDTNRDGDKLDLTGRPTLFTMTYKNNSDGEFGTTASGGNYSLWESDPADSTHSTYIDYYGNEIDYINPSSSPDNIKVKVPESIVTPKVFVTSGAVSAGTTATGGLALIVDDSKVDTVKDNNLVVVGGSCINAAAAKILGSDVPLCAEAFTEKTLVGVNQYIIKTVASPYNAAKVAILVAGYEGADTISAAKLVAEKTIKTDVGTSQVYPIASA